MSNQTKPTFVSGLNVTVPEVADDAKSVQLNVDTSGIKDFDKNVKKVEESMSWLQGINNTLAQENATHAHALFAAHPDLNEVETDLSVGGVSLNLRTHREFSEGDGDPIEFLTQNQVTTPIGNDVFDVLSELNLD